jgi:hypothetical protein
MMKMVMTRRRRRRSSSSRERKPLTITGGISCRRCGTASRR